MPTSRTTRVGCALWKSSVQTHLTRPPASSSRSAAIWMPPGTTSGASRHSCVTAVHMLQAATATAACGCSSATTLADKLLLLFLKQDQIKPTQAGGSSHRPVFHNIFRNPDSWGCQQG